MNESSRKSVFMRPTTIAEMMPHLDGLLPEGELRKWSIKKSAMKKVEPNTTSTDFKPFKTLNASQLRAQIQALQPRPTPTRFQQPASAIKRWNTSTKCENKHVSHFSNNSKKFTARKILDFHPPSKPVSSNRQTNKRTFLTPKQVKQEKKIYKMLNHLQAKASTRISGICKIQQTPLEARLVAVSKIKSSCVENKENIPKQTINDLDESFRHLTGNKKTPLRTINGSAKKSVAPYKPVKPVINSTMPESIVKKKENKNNLTPNTLQVNELFKQLQCKEKPHQDPSPTYSQANSELSFLEREKVINSETSKKTDEITEQTPIVSTPFRNYRNVEQYNESNELDNTNVSCNLTAVERIKTFDKSEGDISKLCDLLNKAKVTQQEIVADCYQTELLRLKNDIESEKKIIIEMLKRKENMLEAIDKLLNMNSVHKSPQKIPIVKSPTPKKENLYPFPWRTEISKTCQPRSDILQIRRIISPTYTIPRKSPCLRKRLLCKSVPANLDTRNTESYTSRPKSAALSMYLKMKEQCDFLVTPVANRTLPSHVTNTPAITSFKLQNQLEMLYEDTP